MRGVFGVLKKIETPHAFFLNRQARIFECGFAVRLNHLRLNVVVDLEDEHSDTQYGIRNTKYVFRIAYSVNQLVKFLQSL